MLTVVGIGADGWAGLGEEARAALRDAPLVLGSGRQLDLLPADVGGERRPWPSPMEPALDALAAGGDAAAVLASGDPMLHGVGASLVRRAGSARVRVLPHPSAFTLACARMGWPAAEATLVSAVARPVDVVARELQPGRRLVVYVTGRDGAAGLARALVERGFGASALTVLEQLGGPAERRVDMTAADAVGLEVDPLHLACVVVAGDGPAYARTPGLPDDAFVTDGQLTKRHVRAVTLAALAPKPGERLWDVGAGTATIAIEWLRAEPTASAVAIEPRPDRVAHIAENARVLGVPALEVVEGEAPAALAGLPAPDAIFVGGGITAPGLLDACWDALRPGGRLVANVVTLEGERVVGAARTQRGGELVRLEVSHAGAVGGFTAWRAQMPVVQWNVVKP